MDKRLAKRHKRQVERARQHVKLSEPDVRTPEQIEAARAASRADRSRGNDPKIAASGPTVRRGFTSTTSGAAKTDG